MRTLGDAFRRRASSILRTGATRPSPVSRLTILNPPVPSSNWNRRTDQAMTSVRPRPATTHLAVEAGTASLRRSNPFSAAPRSPRSRPAPFADPNSTFSSYVAPTERDHFEVVREDDGLFRDFEPAFDYLASLNSLGERPVDDQIGSGYPTGDRACNKHNARSDFFWRAHPRRRIR